MDDPYRILEVGRDASAAEVRRAWRRLARRLHPDAGGDTGAMAAVNGAYERIRASRPGAHRRGEEDHGDAGHGERSFSLDVLPVEAFHALEVAVAALGEVVAADEPYLLEAYLAEPVACFCVLELVPEAGGTIVTVAVGPAEGVALPPASAVVDALADALTGC